MEVCSYLCVSVKCTDRYGGCHQSPQQWSNVDTMPQSNYCSLSLHPSFPPSLSLCPLVTVSLSLVLTLTVWQVDIQLTNLKRRKSDRKTGRNRPTCWISVSKAHSQLFKCFVVCFLWMKPFYSNANLFCHMVNVVNTNVLYENDIKKLISKHL